MVDILDGSVLQILGPLGGMISALVVVWRLALRVQDDMTARYESSISAHVADVAALRGEVHRLAESEMECQRQTARLYGLLAQHGIAPPTPPFGNPVVSDGTA